MELTRKKRIERSMVVLHTLDYCREKAGDPLLGEELEKTLLSRELRDLSICTSIDEIDEEIKRCVNDSKT